MKRLFSLFLGLIILETILPLPVFAASLPVSRLKADTIVVPFNKEEDKVIDEVIESKAPVKKEKAAYLNEVTKYGFKDLFKNYSYNALIPYSSQVNPYAENYMQDYLHAHSKYLKNLQTTGRSYFNFIDGILAQYGLPQELKYLAVIESNLKSTALSSAGALGPWQFMSYTARDYGLKVNNYQDDRTDYLKSTNAAARYLLHLYKDLKDWLLVIAAYNGGPGRVYSAIRKSGSRNFWDLQYYLPEESRNHVKKFIATHYIMETGDKAKGGLADTTFDYSSLSIVNGISTASHLPTAQKPAMLEMPVSGRYKAAIIARNIDMGAEDFDRYNPGFDKTLATGATYNMHLPGDKMTIFVANKYPILNECVQQLFRSTN